ncbi:NADH dehydrogenase [ubiquinone] 1 beta subcomplex subunit 9 [Leptopilina boulardi]|uniref:NADH dehydrogenase [ubiquinone] 1 beta subcomplex subunit 9 n=1 Tax=Leptopilina boulardi TaxID=63433 RepID=UPI0021F68967|nr:NADH dehydrogenase [ubiquinone] 1 beta subcomplex subunit 9 [Leptopilina boulardi]
MANIPTGLLSHSQKVCRLYKAILRNIDGYCQTRVEFRYHAVIIRSKFDENKDLRDLRIAKQKIMEGEEWLFKHQHPIPKKFAESIGGCAYGRDVILPDWLLDFWDPWEKAFYPKYFAKREKRKKNYVEFYKKTYGEPEMPHH